MSDSEEAWELIYAAAADARDADLDYTELTLDQLDGNISDFVRDVAQNPWTLTSDEALSLHGDCLLREAVRLIGEDAVREKYPLPPQEKVWERYPDGSTEEHVVTEEVDDAISRYNLYPIEVTLEVLEWHKAAQAVFIRRFKEKGFLED